MRRGRRPGPAPVPRAVVAEAIAQVTEDYLAFLREGANADPKEFAARQAAARAALAHLAELGALAGEEAEEAEAAGLDTLLEHARGDMAREDAAPPPDGARAGGPGAGTGG